MSTPHDRNEPTDPHARRMNRVLDYIDQHLADDLKLETLAEIAAYSPYHFHRLFLAWTSETPNDLVRRRRLEAAGSRLRHSSSAAVADVAAAVGFASVEAFARAFKQQFGMTPTGWRKGGYMEWEMRQRESVPEFEAAPVVRLERLPELEVLYWRHTGPYGASVVETWERFVPWIKAMGLGEQPLIGMGLDDPSIAPASRCRYDACVVLPPNWNSPATRVSRRKIRGGWFACVDFQGSRTDFGPEWMRILRRWLPGSGFTLADCPFIEYYPAGVSPTPPAPAPGEQPVIRVELRVPVEA